MWPAGRQPLRRCGMGKISVAIDGPAGAGKSSVARIAAERTGYVYLDTGAMYRAFTWAFLRARTDLDDAAAVQRIVETTEITAERDGVFVNGTDVTASIRKPAVSGHVSAVAALAPVREKLVQLQRKTASTGGVILDGRDIGTVVLPDAELKVFLTASIASRAKRRWLELRAKGGTESLAEIEANIAARDKMDSEREISPLREAADAVHIDNSDMDLEETADLLCRLIKEREA